MSEESKRQVEIDQKIGELVGVTTQIIISMRSALQREWEMEQLLEEYYTLLKVAGVECELPPRINALKKDLEVRAERLGISNMRKAEE